MIKAVAIPLLKFTDANGAPLIGGKLYSYLADTTTPQPLYTDSTGDTEHTNPVILDGTGSTEIWLNGNYQLLLTDANDVPVPGWPINNVTSNSDVSLMSEWVIQSGPFSYVSATSFSLKDDYRTTFRANRRVRVLVTTGGTITGTVTSSTYSAYLGGLTTVVVLWDSTQLNSGLSSVSVGLLDSVADSLPRGILTATTPTSAKATMCDVDAQLPVTTSTKAGTATNAGQVQAGGLVYAAASGGTDAYVITMAPAPASWVAGMKLCFKADVGNTGTCSINPNSLGAKTLKKYGTVNLDTGDILAGQIIEVIYDGTNCQVLSPLASVPYVKISDTKAQNTAGGTFTSGAWRTRDLNTEDHDTAEVASLATNQITLAAGTYRCRIHAPAWAVNANLARLQNVTDTATILSGTSGLSPAASGGESRSMINGIFTIAASKALEVQHYCATTRSTDGLGIQGNLGPEVYTVAEFWKIG